MKEPAMLMSNSILVKPLRLDLDFGYADCDVVICSLIVKVSNHGQRNNERADNCYCERFHPVFSSLGVSASSRLRGVVNGRLRMSHPYMLRADGPQKAKHYGLGGNAN
jgi:hypothetical protein